MKLLDIYFKDYWYLLYLFLSIFYIQYLNFLTLILKVDLVPDGDTKYNVVSPRRVLFKVITACTCSK